MSNTRVTLDELRRSVALNPSDPQVFNVLGSVLVDVGETEEALTYLRRAAALDPTSAQYQRNVGWCLEKMNRHENAVEHYRNAIALNSQRGDFYRDLGLLLARSTTSSEDVQNLLVNAITVSPDDPSNYLEFCRLLPLDGTASAALSMIRPVMTSTGKPIRFYHAVACRLEDYGNYEEVKVCCLEALKSVPDDIRILTVLGRAEVALGKLEAAMDCYRRVFLARPTDPEAVYTYLIHLARLGQYEAVRMVYREYISSSGARGLMRKSPLESKAEWKGSSLEGKTLLVKNVAGYGDAIQFIRFVEVLKEIGARVIVECRKPLQPLLTLATGVDCAVLKYQPCSEYDYICDPQYAGMFLDWSWERITRNIPYFNLPAELKYRWSNRIADHHGSKVGICWMSSRRWENNRYRCRSIPLEKLRGLAELSDVCLYSLQVAEEGGAPLPDRDSLPITDLTDAMVDFAETAGAVSALDLVVTVDTAVAHLAGALGKPCFLMLPSFACWRWMTEGDDCLWYPTMRLFRQTAPGDWDGVAARVVRAVREFTSVESKK